MKNRIFLLASALVFSGFLPCAHAVMMDVSLVVDGVILQGANYVPVDATDDNRDNPLLYKVRFSENSCAGIYGSCDASTIFDFDSQLGARGAAQALLDHVFIDGLLGNFDSQPELTFGCLTPLNNRCVATTLYRGGVFFASGIGADNNRTEQFDRLLFGVNSIDKREFSMAPSGTLAVWTRIPEPTSLALIGLGIAGLGFRRKASACS